MAIFINFAEIIEKPLRAKKKGLGRKKWDWAEKVPEKLRAGIVA